MKYFFAIFISLSCCNHCNSQPKTYPFYQLYQLDSIGQTGSVSCHFGKLYFYFLQLVEKKLDHADSTTQKLVRHFETVFAQFYIDACTAYQHHEQITLPAWRTYFTDTTLDFFQYYLLGANAHLNGGLAEAIAGSYTPAEWSRTRKSYSLFNSCLNKTYRLVYRETMDNNKRAKALHVITFGLDKPFGHYLLYKWRKREMRLTRYFYTGSPRYKKLYDKIYRKKERLDQLVFRKL